MHTLLIFYENSNNHFLIQNVRTESLHAPTETERIIFFHIHVYSESIQCHSPFSIAKEATGHSLFYGVTSTKKTQIKAEICQLRFLKETAFLSFTAISNKRGQREQTLARECGELSADVSANRGKYFIICYDAGKTDPA